MIWVRPIPVPDEVLVDLGGALPAHDEPAALQVESDQRGLKDPVVVALVDPGLLSAPDVHLIDERDRSDFLRIFVILGAAEEDALPIGGNPDRPGGATTSTAATASAKSSCRRITGFQDFHRSLRSSIGKW